MADMDGGLKKSKLMLAIGIVVFSVLYGSSVLLRLSDELVRALSTTIWVVFFIYCLFVIMKYKKTKKDFFLAFRLVVVAIVAWLILWLQPWASLSNIVSYASSMPGILVGIFIVYWILSMCASAILFCFIAFTVKSVAHLNVLTVIRFLCITAVSGLIMLLDFALFYLYGQLISTDLSEYTYFIDSLVTQLLLGISYYFVASLFLKENKPNGNILEETDHE